jgi:pyrimidine operon attenuation protein/uracil phosphoribosyltransferase
MSSMTSPLDAEALYLDLQQQIRSRLQQATAAPALVGIHSGGAWLAERLASDLGLAAPGYVDISFYRDDYARKGLHPEVKPSRIPFAVDGADILLVDDVLHTGRTVRAAVNELFDYGRPARIQLAVLVERSGRELPIAADFAAHRASPEDTASYRLRRDENGRFSLSTHHA